MYITTKAKWNSHPVRWCTSHTTFGVSMERVFGVTVWWSVCCHGTTGTSCGHISQEGHLSETCCHAIIAQTCSAAKLLVCCIDMETHCERRMGKGMDDVRINTL